MKRCVAVLDMESFKQLLQLPHEAQVVDIRVDHWYGGQVEIAITGIGPETQEGYVAKRVLPTATVVPILTVKWE